MPKQIRFSAWVYNPRPRGWGPAHHLGLEMLRKLVIKCQQDENGKYHLPGTTFCMTIEPEMARRLWD